MLSLGQGNYNRSIRAKSWWLFQLCSLTAYLTRTSFAGDYNPSTRQDRQSFDAFRLGDVSMRLKQAMDCNLNENYSTVAWLKHALQVKPKITNDSLAETCLNNLAGTCHTLQSKTITTQ